MIRFEILLPRFYDDARPIEPEHFTATDDDLIELFGANSTELVTVRGKWQYKSVLYSDLLVRVRVDVEDTPENWDAMRRLKETLKERFQQLDIWITAHRIEVI